MTEKDGLRGLTGTIITPEDPGYDKARQGFNRAIQKYPLVIVYCRNVRDVQNAVHWARKRGMQIRVRSGGHNYEGYSNGNGVLVIDVSEMNALHVDKACRVLTVQSGAQNSKIYAALARWRLPFPGGACPTVRVSGYTMGGGWGYFSRLLGLGSDNLVALQMVDYRGRLITADRHHNSGLLWACQGGGDGNFGVVTSLRFRLPRPTGDVTYFTLYRKVAGIGEQAAFLEFFQTWVQGLTPRMTLRPSLYNFISEGLALYSQGVLFGKPAEAAAILKPLTQRFGLALRTRLVSFHEATMLLGAAVPESEMYQSTGRFVQRVLTPQEIMSFVRRLETRPEGVDLLEFALYPLGGSIAALRPQDTAFYYRDARYILGMQALWTDPAHAENGRQWLAESFGIVEPFTAGSYVNFPYDCITDYETAYYGGNLRRLRAVKQMYDPKNVFEYPQSIRPIIL